ncbi:hypothetical protein DL89DRAFT_253575 [Linderina pennispora]|uniref:INO80 complex subunit B-like conserved region domain-containing protein n=1 Tax=Linderina pennispora TaxID=61395 RepID=A0A1Y1WJ64_9FUNG|nr:uncharacterized protein DL89DRAFT_253575 [Linderina pennispora]ORX73621.1 hypothetical protein DL89DRAFT_253575 [Linderina pennispora]
MTEELMELPTEAKKTKFSVEEMALRKSEQARRRKFQSMQREEQLKNDTINRLLNKQTSKGRNKVDEPETRSASEEPGADTHDHDSIPSKVCKGGQGKARGAGASAAPAAAPKEHGGKRCVSYVC